MSRACSASPGEENIYLTDALSRSSIRYVLVRHEQAASFMAEIHGRLDRPGRRVLGHPGARRHQPPPGTADAYTNSTPMLALSAQVGLNRIYKESHQSVDLVSMFSPVTKWADLILTPASIPEMVRKAFKLAQTERPGSVYLGVPEDVEAEFVDDRLLPLEVNTPRTDEPSPSQIARAAVVLDASQRPIILAGHGAARSEAAGALLHFSEQLGLPVATTFHGKGVFPDDHPYSLGAVGFMSDDYVNFGFDDADVIVSVGYELQEFDPVRINPDGDKQIIHLSRVPAEVDARYVVEVGIQADIASSLAALGEATTLASTRERGAKDPAAPGRRIGPGGGRRQLPAQAAAHRRGHPGRPGPLRHRPGRHRRREDVDGPPLPHLRAEHLPGLQRALDDGLRAARRHRRQAGRARAQGAAAVGDGAFLMNSQELETARREHIPLTVLIWEDGAYGLIGWKMDLELGHHVEVGFSNPDFVAYAESFGARATGWAPRVTFCPCQEALAADTVSVITCPVDYTENLRLTDALGELSGPF